MTRQTAQHGPKTNPNRPRQAQDGVAAPQRNNFGPEFPRFSGSEIHRIFLLESLCRIRHLALSKELKAGLALASHCLQMTFREAVSHIEN
jgi:hypothetical protein